jgi:hypothetical protein
LLASAFSRAAKSNFSPFACAVVISNPIVTWRNSSSTVRESGCGFHDSLSSGKTVSLAIARILLCTLRHELRIAVSYVGAGFACSAMATAFEPSINAVTASHENRFIIASKVGARL